MSSFNFRRTIKESIYHSNYPHADKTSIIINEGQTVLLETEIHEGILDAIRAFPGKGWRRAMADEVDKYLAKSTLNDREKQQLKSYYMKNFEKLPDEEIKQQDAADIEDSLEAAADGDIDVSAK